MEVVTDRSCKRPLPAPGPVCAPFWRAAAAGELRIQRCPECDRGQFYPRPVCIRCGATPVWETASGKGSVHTFTVIRQYGAPPFKDELPYVVAIIDLEEGVQMMGNLTDCDIDRVEIGMAVEAYSLRVQDEIALVLWRPRVA